MASSTLAQIGAPRNDTLVPLAFPSHQGVILPLWRRFPRAIDGVAVSVGAMPDVVGHVDVEVRLVGRYPPSMTTVSSTCTSACISEPSSWS